MDNVNVAIRVRPLIQREKIAEAEPQWKAETNKISQLDHKGRVSRIYAFDRIFNSSETTSDVYEEIALPIVEKAMDGVNGTIFAYGQTASGKTYTMMGDRMCPGIIPQAVQNIFTQIDNTSNREFLLRVSYMELYNEGLSDLLTSEKKTLQIRENDKTVFVHELTEEVVTNVQEVLQFLKKGEARRHFGQTDMNEKSSRSHTIFRMIIESRETSQARKSVDNAVKVSHLNLVDLAGSERANETKADGIRLREACKINQSLHVLAMVINKLSQGAEFIPFRDSKLTRILQMSLGGNAKTAIICTVTPISVEQTHSTLQFASRAKTIKNKPLVNEVVSDEAMMQRQKKEIKELKRKISELEQQGELEKTRLHETQEQKIKMLEKMILVSGGAGISGIMATNETTKAKFKRRQTWCPGMANPLPLLRSNPPAELASHIVEETLSSPETTTQSSGSTEEAMRHSGADASPPESVTSVESEDFSNTKQFRFWEDMEKETEDSIISAPLSPQRKKRKRREAHVHFANFGADTVDAECQTEVNSPNATDASSQAESLLEANTRCSELQKHILALEDTVTTLRENGAVLSQVTESKGSAERQLADLMTVNQGLESRIQELEERNLMVSQLSDALCLSEEKVADLESRTQDADHQISTMTEDVRLLRAQLENTNSLKELAEEQQKEAMKEQLDAFCLSEEKVADLESQTQDADHQISVLTEDVRLLKAQLENTNSLKESAEEKQQEAMKEQLDALCVSEEKVADLESRTQDADHQISKLTEDVRLLKAQLEDTNGLKKESAEEKQQDAMKEQLDALCLSEEKVADLESRTQDADHQISILTEDVRLLKAQLENTNSLKESAEEKQQEAMKEQLDALCVSEEKVADLESRTQDADHQISILTEDVRLLKAQLENTNSLKESAEEKQQEAMKEQLDALCVSEEKVADLESRTQDADHQISILTEDVRLLKAQLENTNSLKESAEEKQQEVMKEQLDEQDKLKATLSNSKQELVSLRATLEETKLLLASAEEREGEVVLVKMQLDQQEDGLKDSLHKSELEISSLKAQLEEYEVRSVTPLENEQKVLDLTAQHDQLRNLFEKSEQEILVLKEELHKRDFDMKSIIENKEIVLKCQLEQQDGMKDLLLSKEQELLALKVELEEKQTQLASAEESALRVSKELSEALSAPIDEIEEAEEIRNHDMAVGPSTCRGRVGSTEGAMSLADEIEKAEETRNHDKVAGPSIGCVGSTEGAISLADEIEEQHWKVKARRTESDLLVSVQLCEDIMKEKTKLSRQVSQLQDEMTNLRGALKAKKDELNELQEFTNMEVTIMKEQEAQYQKDIEELRLELQEKRGTLAVQHHKEIEDLQKKLSVKDKVLEAQYQQDVDELLDKLREKNQKLNNLQEQQSGLVQAAGLAEQKVEHLQCQLRDLESCGGTKENGSIEGQDQAAVKRVIDQQVQTEEYNSESSCHTAVSLLEEATQVSPEDLGLLGDGSSVQPEVLQQRIDELEGIKASLRQDCETLNATINSQDQEIEVLNELLEDLGQETIDNDENNAKIAAFVERIEQLEQQLQERELPNTKHIKESDVNQEIQVLTEVKENLSKALTEAENRCENLRAKVLGLEESLRHEITSKKDLDSSKEKDLMNLKKELEALNEVNFCLSEKLTCTQDLCEKLEEKLLQSTIKEEKQESEEEICALTAVIEQQEQEMASQRDKLEEAEDNFRSNVRELEDGVASLTRENQLLVERCVSEATKYDHFVEDITSKDILLAEQQNKLATLSERLAKIEEELQGRTVKVQELEAALASQSRQSAEAAEIIRMRDGELEMLREVLQEQEQNLESVKNEFSRVQFRVKDLEREVNFLNETKGNQMVHEGQKENEIHRLRGLLENQEEQLRNKERHLMEYLSKIQNLESVLAANNHTNLVKSKAEAEQNAKVHKLQSYLEELENQLRAREITGSELEAKLQDLERVVAASDQKRVDLEGAKLKLESEVKTLQGYLDEVDEELHQFKNRYADLQADFRKQQANIKNMNAVLESRSQSTKMLEAAVAKHNEEVGVLRALLDERNCTALRQEDKYCDMLAKIQNLEGIITSKEQTTKESDDSLKMQDAELRRLRAAHASYQEQQDRRLQEEITRREEEILKLQQQLEKATTDRAKLDDLEVKRSSVDELMKTHRQQLAEKNLRINQLETDLLRGTDPLERKLVSLKEELSYQESKMQQYKKEVEKLRSQQSQRAPSASSTTPGSSSFSERVPEATGGSGIIESCAIFAVKAENYKLTKALEKTKKELDYKDLKYHDEVTKKTHAEQDTRYWKEKARSLASHLKRAPQRKESVTASPLKERNMNDVPLPKKSRSDDSTGTRYIEKIGGLKSSSSESSSSASSSSSKGTDYNWLSKAVAERDAEEKQDDDPQQCATQ